MMDPCITRDTFDKAWELIDWSVWRYKPIPELCWHLHQVAVQPIQPCAQQAAAVPAIPAGEALRQLQNVQDLVQEARILLAAIPSPQPVAAPFKPEPIAEVLAHGPNGWLMVRPIGPQSPTLSLGDKLYTSAPSAAISHCEREMSMLIRRIVSSARRNCEDGSNVLKLANEAWGYLVGKGLHGSPLRGSKSPNIFKGE